MAAIWKVIIIDATGGSDRLQDMTAIGAVDMQKSSFQPTTSSRPTSSRLILSFPIDTPDLKITELMEVWAGWVDESTNHWLNDPPPFGGYITRIDAETVYGGEKTFECTLSDYNWLLTHTDVRGWPQFLINLPLPSDNVGYPAGYSVRDWLVGSVEEGKPYDGVVRAHLGNGMLFDGIDPLFDTILFPAEGLPGMILDIPGLGAITGYFGGANTTVNSVVQAIADQTAVMYWVSYTGVELVVGYWMSAAGVGESIVPRFNMRNTADIITAPDYVVATDADPLAGEIQMLHPHRHERDASSVRTVVNLIGLGGDETVPGYPLVQASYIHPEHSLIYPTKYQLVPGWGGGPVYEPRLHLISTARTLAEVIENRVWGAKGSIEFYVDRQITAGQRVRVRDPNEAIDRVYIVVESEGPDDNGHWRVRVGFTQPTISDVLNGGMSDVLLVREDLAWKRGELGSRLLPGQQQRTGIDLQPTTPARNHVTAGYTDTPGLTIQTTGVVRPTDDPDAPAPAPAPGLRVLPPISDTNLTPNPGTWTSNLDARPHPQVYPMGFSEDGVTSDIPVPWDMAINRIKVNGTGSATLNKNGVAVAGPFSAMAGWQEISPPVLFQEALDDYWSVEASGVGSSLRVAISEP